MAFLDRQPFNATDSDGRELLAALQAAYDQAPAVREFVLAAGLRSADFSWLLPMSQIWPEVLRKAADCGRLRSLITVVARDPGSAAYEVIARLLAEPAGKEAENPHAKRGFMVKDVPLPGANAASGRLAYLEQVRRIAPPDPPGLIGREAELDELIRFCIEPNHGPYTWWQAGAWAGKSALFSTFVLRPPPQVAEQIQIVSFFITARLAAQDTREAFIQVLLEQLAELLEEPLPPTLSEATRETFLLNLLNQAAGICAEVGRRLVLVVDGLDEDRGIPVGTDAHSIAGLLPTDPPHGMRVIVAGRPNPPIPDDVPDWHPLRDRKIIRPLVASPHAQGIRRLARSELKRLLVGSRIEQDTLGLLTAARGGLSARDLEELTGIPLWNIEGVLNASTGRTFMCRASRWAPEISPESYLLGHEELQNEATRYLGEARLAIYRNQLHAWAGTWQARGWSSGTPEYLLSGYFRLLEDQGDLPRMTECALDRIRHNRMLDVTGGDASAMAEVRTVLDCIAAQGAPDVAVALALACYRDRLVDRNANIPSGLPAVWATLNHVPRAEALAASISNQYERAKAQMQLAGALAETGQYEEAIAVASSRTVSNPYLRTQALSRVAEALVAAGHHEHVTAVAQAITDPYWQTEILARIASALAAAGQRQKAILVAAQAAAASTVTSPSRHVQILALAARVLATVGQDKQALSMAKRAKKATQKITVPVWYAEGLARAAGALAAAGQHQQATAVAIQAEKAAQAISGSSKQAEGLILVAEALAAAGQHEQAVSAAMRAEAAARAITDPHRQAEILVHAAGALAAAGQHEQAISMAGRAETAARAITDPGKQVRALAKVAEALAAAGRYEQAASMAGRAGIAARAITDSREHMKVLGQIVGVLEATGQHEQAIVTIRSITFPGGQMEALARVSQILARVASGLAAAGRYEEAISMLGRAETAARAITDSREHSSGAFARVSHILAQVAEGLASAGRHEEAISILGRAETAARAITDSREHSSEAFARVSQILAQVASGLAAAGRYEEAISMLGRAETAARAITDPRRHSQATRANVNVFVARVAGELAQAGRYEEAISIVGRAETTARELRGPYGDIVPLIDVSQILARIAGEQIATGRYEEAISIVGRAETAARTITDPRIQSEALMCVSAFVAWVAGELAAAGRYEEAISIADRAETAAQTITDPRIHSEALARVSQILAQVAEGLASAGRHEQAISMLGQAKIAAKGITNPQERIVALGRATKMSDPVGQHKRTRASTVQTGTTARSIIDGSERAEALALAAAGRHKDAAAVAWKITSLGERMKTFREIAKTLVIAGHEDYSAGAVGSIIMYSWQESDLAQLAVTFAIAGDAESASRMAAAACVTEEWTAAAVSVLLLKPSADALAMAMLEP